MAFKMGYLWAFKQVFPESRRGIQEPTTLSDLGPPIIAAEDLCIMIHIDYENPEGKSVEVSWTIGLTEPGIDSFLENGDLALGFPDTSIRLCKAHNWGRKQLPFHQTPRQDGTNVGPGDDFSFAGHKFNCYVRIVRLTDGKSCCIYASTSISNGLWGTVPSVLALDRGNTDPTDCDVDDLDFTTGTESGSIVLDHHKRNHVPVSEASQQGLMIRSRFPFRLGLWASLVVVPGPDATLAVQGVDFTACKFREGGDPGRLEYKSFYADQNDEDEDDNDDEEEQEEQDDEEHATVPQNDGVTISHFLANLHFS